MTPTFKSVGLSLVANYRPISLLSRSSNLVERLIRDMLMTHLSRKCFFLSNKQFGFRPGSSTQEVLLAVSKDWYAILVKHGSVGCVFFELSKAFDTLPHLLILQAQSRMCIRILTLLV